MAAKVTDLRSALKMLEDMPGQLIETDVEVEPMAELSGVYRHVGAGGTVMRPTKETISWLHAASASAMCTVRFILTVPTSNRSRQ